MGKSLRDWRGGHHALLGRLAGSTRYQRSDSSGRASICGFLSEGLSLGVYCNVGAGYVAASSSRSAHGALLEVHGSAFVYLLSGNHLLDACVSKRQSDFQCRDVYVWVADHGVFLQARGFPNPSRASRALFQAGYLTWVVEDLWVLRVTLKILRTRSPRFSREWRLPSHSWFAFR